MIYKLEADWLSKIAQFKISLDLTKSENIPLKKVIEFIENCNEDSLTQRFSQITVNYIIYDGSHPFSYLSDTPLDVTKSAFDEVHANSLKGVEFSKKMDSTIKELQALGKLLERGFSFNGKTPSKTIEDDFYLVNDEEKPYAFEVKSKQENEYFAYSLETYIRGKMYFHNFQKYIGINEIDVNEKNFKQYVEFFNSKILVNGSIVEVIHFEDKECFDIGNKHFCNSKLNGITVETQKENNELWIRYTSDEINFELTITEDFEDQDASRVSVRSGFSDFFEKVKDNKNIIELEFENYLKGKLEDIKKQYLKPKKALYRKDDIFGGFVYLNIPWNWKWNEKSLVKSFEQLALRVMKQLDIKFFIYFYLYKYEKQNTLLEVKVQKLKMKKLKAKYKKPKKRYI